MAVLDAYRRGLDRLGQAYEVIEADDLPGHIGTAFYRKALFTPVPCWCSPRPWSRAWPANLPGNVSLYEHTDHRRGIWRQDPAEPSPRQHPGRPPGPNNAFGMSFGFLQGRMLPIFTYASLTRPLAAEEQARLGGRPYWGLIPADPYGTTVRRTPDNRLLIRNSFSFNPDGRSAGSTLSASPYAIAPRSASASRCSRKSASTTPGAARWRCRGTTWGTSARAPNVYGALCCNGLGVTRGTVTGKLLADWLAGERNERSTSCCARPVPAAIHEPLLSLGVNLNLRWGQYRAGRKLGIPVTRPRAPTSIQTAI